MLPKPSARLKFAMRLEGLSRWLLTRRSFEHNVDTTLSMLDRKVHELRERSIRDRGDEIALKEKAEEEGKA